MPDRENRSSKAPLCRQGELHMMQPMNYRMITGNTQLQALQQSLSQRDVAVIALDVEAEFNLHVYGERLCLIQLYDGEQLSAVDPLEIDRPLLRAFFEDRGVLKIMYDSLSDQSLLFKTLETRIHSIVDLKPAVDLLQYTRRDLGSVLNHALGITIEKKSRFQRYNWTTRPLAADAVEYALSDVAHLFALKDHLLAELSAAGLIDAYLLKNLMLQNKPPDINRRPRLFRSGEFRNLSASARQRFERIYEIRDGYAREADLPPDTLLAKRHLFQIAANRMPAAALEVNPRVPRPIHRKMVADIEALLDQ